MRFELTSSFKSFGLACSVFLAWSGFAYVAQAKMPDKVEAFIDNHCLNCHDAEAPKANFNLSELPRDLSNSKTLSTWVRLFDRVDKKEMPPDGKAHRIEADERDLMLKLLRDALRQADRADIARNHRGPVRRLTRDEFQDNLRDLLKMPSLDVKDKLPEDRRAHGFTKVAGLLDLSRVHMNAYLDAAEKALVEAVAPSVTPPKPMQYKATGVNLFTSFTTFGGREAMFFVRGNKMMPMNGNKLKTMTPAQQIDPKLHVAVFRSATWPYYGYPRNFRAAKTGTYRVRFAGRAVRQVRDLRIVPAHDPLPMSFRARQPSGPDVSGDVRETGGWIDLQPESRKFQTTIYLKKGETFEYSFLGLPVPFIRTDKGFYYDFPPMPKAGHRGGVIEWLEVEGPLNPPTWPSPSHELLFGKLPLKPRTPASKLPVTVESKEPKKDAERLFRRFADAAAHMPLSNEDYAGFLALIRKDLDAGAPFADAMLKGYQAFLCSNHFLFLNRHLRTTPFAHANRLSHFLWNSSPDERLQSLAKEAKLNEKKILELELTRMLADPRFERFIQGFLNQWLDLADLRRDEPDNRLYPEYRKDDYLVDSMEKETQRFFKTLITENLPVSTVADAKFVFVNDRLAAHYDLPRVRGSTLRKVTLPAWNPRGGLLTQASILKHTSNGTTTSPVLRGVWVMEKIMGNPPPPPPKSIPAVEPDIRGATTIREQLAKHTQEKSCAVCHAHFDPIGFALENFDVMGAWRDRYRTQSAGEKITGYDPAGHPFTYHVGKEVESDGKLLTNESFADIHELKAILAKRPRQLARNLLHQFTLYATGTPVRFSERAEIEQILDHCQPAGYRVGDLLRAFCASQIMR